MRRRRLRALKAELKELEILYRGEVNKPGETTWRVTAAMKKWGPRRAALKHEIKELEGEDDETDSEP